MKGLLIAVPFILVLLLLEGGNSEKSTEIIPGGINQENKPVTPVVKQLVRGMNSQIKSHLQNIAPGGLNIVGRIKPISFKTQVVNGVNYFVKVRARTQSKNVFYHLRIYKGFNAEPAQLIKVEGPKRKKDAITYF